MKQMTNCCVPGCFRMEKRVYRFPNPETKQLSFDTWVTAVRNPILKGLARKDIFEKYRICRVHFDEKFYRGPNIVASAIPTKFLASSKDSKYNFVAVSCANT